MDESDFCDLKAVVERLRSRIDVHESENTAFKSRILALENEKRDGHNPSNAMNWSAIVKNDKSKSKMELEAVNAIVSVNRDIEKRDIIIVGLPVSVESDFDKKKEDDKRIVEEIFESISIDKDKIKRIYRFRPKNTPVEASSSSSTTAAKVQTSPVLVEFESKVERTAIESIKRFKSEW